MISWDSLVKSFLCSTTVSGCKDLASSCIEQAVTPGNVVELTCLCWYDANVSVVSLMRNVCHSTNTRMPALGRLARISRKDAGSSAGTVLRSTLTAQVFSELSWAVLKPRVMLKLLCSTYVHRMRAQTVTCKWEMDTSFTIKNKK